MDRLAKEAKKGKDQPEEKGISTAQGALNRIKAESKASAALKELVQAGFDETTIVQIVLSYCGGVQRVARAGLEFSRAFGVHLESCSSRLEEDADLVMRIIEEGEGCGYRFHLEEQERWKWISEMKSFAAWLSTEAKKVNAGLKNIRLGGEKKRDKKTKKIEISKLDITAGRKQYLVYLAYLVSGEKKPTMRVYKLIAPLVAAVTDEFGRVNSVVAAGLRREVVRFEQMYPDFCRQLAARARLEFDSRRTQLPLTSPRT